MPLPAYVHDRLRAHQRQPVEALLAALERHGSAVDMSDTGTGKTYTGAAVVAMSRLPTLVVCPKIIRTAWAKAAQHFGDSVSVIGYEALRAGSSPFGTWQHPLPKDRTGLIFQRCVFCQQVVNPAQPQPCPAHHRGWHCVETKRKPWRYGAFQWHPAVKQVVWDESHRCAGTDSLNSDMLVDSWKAGKRTLLLSATLASSPLEMQATGRVLGLHGGGDHFYTWARRHGCGKLPGLPGFRWVVGQERRRAIMAEISRSLLPHRGVRVATTDIPGFPERQIVPELYDLEEGGAIDRLYAEMAESLDALSRRADLDKDPEGPLSRLLRAQQKVELLKVPVVEELVRDYRAKGFSVAVFLNYKQTLAELRRRLACDCFIDGSQNSKPGARDHCIDSFQDNTESVILVNSAAGDVAVSLHDLHGGHPRVGLVMPNPSARRMRQLFGRLHRDGSKSPALYRIILAAGTCEEQVHRAMSAKSANIETLNDADLVPEALKPRVEKIPKNL